MLKVFEKTVVALRRLQAARTWRRGFLLGMPLVVVVVGLCAERRPSWYQPVRLDERGIEEARLDALAWIDEVSAKMVRGRPFEVTLKDRDLNRWLAVWIHDREVGSAATHEEFADPSLAFVKGAVRFGALGEYSGWRAIFGLDVEIRVENSTIQLSAARASMGALPLPVSWIDGWTKKFPSTGEFFAGNQLVAVGVNHESMALPLNVKSPFMRSIRNEFMWPNGERAFRIEAIVIFSGEAHIQVHPL